MMTSNVQVALALGSGAARGWAHIGVIQALQEMGVHVHLVAGTSIGSLVGAAFAAGRLNEIESWVRGMDRWEVFNLLDFGFNHGGLIHGEKVFSRAREVIGSIDIEDMPLVYGAVATDLYSGREIWLRKGDVYDAARASCSMPGLLAPTALNGRWLVDGALVNPVPVSLCRALGSDFVIAVNLNSQLNTSAIEARSKYVAPKEPTHDVTAKDQPQVDVYGYNTPPSETTVAPQKTDDEEQSEPGFFHNFLSHSQQYWDAMKEKMNGNLHKAPGMLGVMSGSIDIMQERITKARLAGDPPDILIQPKLGQISIIEFERGNEAIAVGYETTIRMKDFILAELELYKERRGN